MITKNVKDGAEMLKRFRANCVWMNENWPNVPKSKRMGFRYLMDQMDEHFASLNKTEFKLAEWLYEMEIGIMDEDNPFILHVKV
jgi:hypothetical protein